MSVFRAHPGLRTGLAMLLAWLSAWAAPAADPAQAADPPPTPPPTATLRTAREVLSLSSSEAARGHPVELVGTITYYRPEWTLLFVQDQTAGIYLYPGPQTFTHRAGAMVRVRGVTDAGLHSPIVSSITLEAATPETQIHLLDLSLSDFGMGRHDAQWVRIEAVIRHVDPGDLGHWRASIGVHQLPLYITFPGTHSGPTGTALEDARVRATGVAVVRTAAEGGLENVELFVGSAADLEILQPAPADPFSVAVRTTEYIRGVDPALHPHRILARGVVTHLHGPQGLFLQDATGGMQVELCRPHPLSVGETVEVLGFPRTRRQHAMLDHAIVRSAPAQPAVAPVPVDRRGTLPDPGQARLASVETLLVRQHSTADEEYLLCRTDATQFRADLPPNQGRLPRMTPGTVLRLTGVYAPAEPLGPPHLWLRSPLDVAVVQLPSWWGPRQIAVAVSAVIALVALLAGWIIALRRQVRREANRIRSQLHREMAVEERFRDLFENAPDLIYTHTLDGRITWMNRTAERLTGFAREEASTMNFRDLVADSSRPAFEGALRRCADGEACAPVELELRTREGEAFRVETSLRLHRANPRSPFIQGIARERETRDRPPAPPVSAAG